MADVDLFELANSRMSIIKALNLAGASIGEFSAGSVKTYCPFGHLFHADGGSSKALRVYPGTNSAHCFAGCGYFSPVRLVAKINDTSEVEAAEFILEKTHYVAPDYQSQWDAVVQKADEVDQDGLSEALKVACARMDPQWSSKQFDEAVATALRRCLGLLPKVTTPEEAKTWLSVTKQVMDKTLRSTS